MSTGSAAPARERLLALGATGLLMCASCGHAGKAPPAAPAIVIPGGIQVIPSEMVGDVVVGHEESVGTIMLCAECSTRPIRIDSVTLFPDAKNFQLVDFGTRPNPWLHKGP